MKTGKVVVEVIPAVPAYESRCEERMCDICGENATGRTPCSICRRDLCSEHQLDVQGRIHTGEYKETNAIQGHLFCEDCLIKAIQNLIQGK